MEVGQVGSVEKCVRGRERAVSSEVTNIVTLSSVILILFSY